MFAKPVVTVVDVMSIAFMLNVAASLSIVTACPAVANNVTPLKFLPPMSLM